MSALKHYFPLIIVGLAFLWSCITIATRRVAEAPPGTIVVRIAHYQLESGARDAFEKLGKDFANLPEIKKFGDVRIVQEAIPAPLYGQWLTSQMMARQAPDLVEYGQLPTPMMLAIQNRYMLPLNELASAPNPFNAGTPLEGKPLKETFVDGMRSGYQEEMQAYTRVPLSAFSQRIFYNKTLLRKLTGLDAPPTEMRAFLALCEKIAAQPVPQNAGGRGGQNYIPIASSQYHAPRWFENISNPLSYRNLFSGDFNRDGTVGTDETYAAFATGRMSLNDHPWRARFEVMKQFSLVFQPGFVGLERDEALFLFAQQKAVFISSGTWDVNSLIEQAIGKFEVGIAVFPLPTPQDPELGPLVLGPVRDPADSGFPFGITRFAKHPEIAQLFLQFLASVKGNTELNHTIGWIPNVIGVPLPPALADFKPTPNGMYFAGNFLLGGKSLVEHNIYTSLLQSDPKYTYDDFMKQFVPSYLKLGRDDWEEQQRDFGRTIAQTEQTVVAFRGEAMLAGATEEGQRRWIRYRSATTSRVVFPKLDRRVVRKLMETGPRRPIAPYNYLPEALERARSTLNAPPLNTPPATGAQQ
jgi:ABC-type glycerol-3-phosphate transport system substrate-binding protein